MSSRPAAQEELDNLLLELENFELMIPDELLVALMQEGGLECPKVSTRRLLGLAIQRDMNDLISKCRSVDGTDSTRLTVDTLNKVLGLVLPGRHNPVPTYVADRSTADDH
ncbi:cyclin-dependent kinase [Carpediemonas membranifera]|uniref:Cyclin-dependent kinase n=1 Tax=Carpediemonas membranifera TaxID=201153 RepID=A0A8J6B2B1_9EUKA|nr:cyclin-dependent kinase [Carpediemonas membranifera]|eukprot:KAG9396900.1 cyclin-dependent kinase [Carpediemonas membranifera]